MNVTASGDGRKGMTLAFELSACRQLATPARVFEDAREWSRHVGIVSNDIDAITSYTQEHGLTQDFDIGDRDKWLALQELRIATDTDRHVFVGTTEEDRRVAEQTGWEFVHVREAAEKAGWALAKNEDGSITFLDRLLSRLRE